MKLRRIFSLLIAAAFIVSMLPLGAIATDHEELISEAVAAPLGEGGENSAGAPQPDQVIEIPEGEPDDGDGLPSDVIGDPGDKQGETPEDPGTGETPEDPGEGDPTEGKDPEQPKEDEDPEAGEEGEEDEEGEEPAEEPVDVTTLFGKELARYIEELEAKEDIDGFWALLSVLTEEQFQSLFGVETTSIAIAELLRSRSNNVDEEEIIEYYPASMVPAGPILQGAGSLLRGVGMQAAGGMIAGAAGFGAGLLSEPASVSSVPVPPGMTVDKSANVKGQYGPGENDRQYFQLDLTVHVESDIQQTKKPADIVLVLDVSGSMSSNMTKRTYTATNNPKKGDPYYIDLDPSPDKTNWQLVEYHSGTLNGNHWCYGTHFWVLGWLCTQVNPSPGGTGTNGNYQFYIRTDTTISKIQALKDAVNSFLAEVKDNSPESTVAIVTYAANANVLTGTKDNTAGAMIPIKVGSDVNPELTTAVNGLGTGGGTYSDKGFERATKIMQSKVGQSGYDDEGRNRVVIHFTDGEPGSGSSVDHEVAADVIRWAKVLKNGVGQTTTVTGVRFPASGNPFSNGNDTINPATGCGATVYTIGVFTSTMSDQNKTNEYMWRSSSNTDDGSSHTDYSPNTVGPGKKGAYYLTADSADSLTNIFEQIGQEMNDPVEGSVRDYISPEFELCDANGVAIDITSLPKTVDPGPGLPSYTIKKDAQDRIYVEWANLTIEPGESFAGTVYIKPKETFVGGNNLLTNIGGISAVYSGNNILASFPEPKVNVPFKLGTGAYADDIYLGSIIDAGMVTAARNDMLNDIFKGYNYSALGTVTPSWTTNPTNLRPTNAVNTYNFSVTVNPTAAAAGTKGRPAKQATATGVYTVNVHGATLTAQGWTILKGQTAVVLSGVQKTLTWDVISGKPVPTDVSYEILFGGAAVTSNPQLTESRTFTMVAKRNGVEVAERANFTVTVVAPTFTDKNYNILLGESVGSRYTVGGNLGVGIDYSGTGGLTYNPGELTYVPNYSGYDSPFATHVPSVIGTYTVPVTVKYGSTTGVVIGSANVTVNVSVPTFTGKTFELLNGEQAKADGYNAHSDGVNTPDYAAGGVPDGLTYPSSSLTYTLADGSTYPDTRLSADAVNKINVFYNGKQIAQNVAVTFNVHTPTFAGNIFDLFYGEKVTDAYSGITALADAITINKPEGWPTDTARTARWTDYEAMIQGTAKTGFEQALDTVYPPGNPNPIAQFPVTMKYVYGTGPSEFVTLAAGDNAPTITINVTAGSITITKSVSANGKGTVDPDQTFLFKITRTDGDTTEVFYEYINTTNSATKTITGLKKGVYEVTEVKDWSWRYNCTSAVTQSVTLGRTGTGDNPFTASGSTSFTNNKRHDSWLSDEATPKANNCGTVPIPGTQSAKTEAAILPGKQNGLPEDGSVEQA